MLRWLVGFLALFQLSRGADFLFCFYRIRLLRQQEWMESQIELDHPVGRCPHQFRFVFDLPVVLSLRRTHHIFSLMQPCTTLTSSPSSRPSSKCATSTAARSCKSFPETTSDASMPIHQPPRLLHPTYLLPLRTNTATLLLGIMDLVPPRISAV